MTLFEKLDRSPDSSESRRLVTASNQYGITKGSYTAEYLELTSEGQEATGDEVLPAKRLQARFQLAIKNHTPFEFLYDKLKGSKMPAKEVLADYLVEAAVDEAEAAESIETFTLNLKFLGLLRTIAGSERIVPLEQSMEESASAQQVNSMVQESKLLVHSTGRGSSSTDSADTIGDFAKTCFYVSPIGEEDSEARRHADFLTEYIIKPACRRVWAQRRQGR